MKSILVLVGGSDSDESVFDTAVAAARPFAAHLQFLHVQVSPGTGQAAAYSPHADFADGLALRNSLSELQAESNKHSEAALRYVRDYCTRSMVELCDEPNLSSRMTASWVEERDNVMQRTLFHARHSDMVVVGRHKRPSGLPPDFLESLVLGCGRPVLVAGPNSPGTLMGTIVVGWKNTAEAARAVTAAMPLLKSAKRLVFVGVEENNQNVRETIHNVVHQIAWHGILAESEIEPPLGRTVEEEISAAAKRWNADLIVVGAYGHARLREVMFGGCTQAFIFGADRPVLLMH